MAHRILFLDVGDTCRGPMAAGWASHYGLAADSAGTMPGRRLDDGSVTAMADVDIDISHTPRHLEFVDLPRYERIIALGNDVAQTDPDVPLSATWNVEDPEGRGLEVQRRVRDLLQRKVRELAEEIHTWDPSA